MQSEFNLTTSTQSVQRDYSLLLQEVIASGQVTQQDIMTLTSQLESGNNINVVVEKQIVKQAEWLIEKIQEILDENLRQWFRDKWVRFGPDGKIRGDCARGDDSEGKPKCLPQSKAHSLGKKGRATAAARKRREDPNPERKGAAKNVRTK